MYRLAPLMILVLAASGCSSNSRTPQDRFYRLPPARAEITRSERLAGAIFVDQFQSSGLHGERALVYTLDPGAVELEQYHYHYWIDSPTRLIRDHLIDYLRVSGSARLVLDMDIPAAGLKISGRIKQFERSVRDSNASVLVALEIRVDRDTDPEPLLVRTYSGQIEAGGTAMEMTATAFAEALNSIFSRLLRDLRDELAD